MVSAKLNVLNRDSRVTPDFVCILAIFPRSGKSGWRRFGGGFINKDKPFQIQRWLFFPEGIMGGGDIVLVLLGGMDVLFLKGLRGIEWVGLRA
jgi:hypothetical protein